MTKSTLFLLAISPFILFYMVGAFIGLQFNPIKWEEGSRFVYVLLSLGFNLGLGLSVYLNDVKIK